VEIPCDHPLPFVGFALTDRLRLASGLAGDRNPSVFIYIARPSRPLTATPVTDRRRLIFRLHLAASGSSEGTQSFGLPGYTADLDHVSALLTLLDARPLQSLFSLPGREAPPLVLTSLNVGLHRKHIWTQLELFARDCSSHLALLVRLWACLGCLKRRTGRLNRLYYDFSAISCKAEPTLLDARHVGRLGSCAIV
jgi:hypothetical protein